MPTQKNIAIIGVGLIGGSIGLAVQQHRLAIEIVGIGRRKATLDKALARGAITRATTDLADGVAKADLVIVCTPVAQIVEHVCQVLAAAPAHAIVTDAGSTKGAICGGIASQAADPGRFVGSHPLAGDHRTGPENARVDLFDEKTVVMTPDASTTIHTTTQVEALWCSLGARVVKVSPGEHDQGVASTSHLPHLVAAALAESTPEQWLSLAATGWADTTRVAAGDPGLWTQIFSQNTPPLLAALDRMISCLEQVRTSLVAADWAQTEQHLAQAKRIRDALGN
ncbi:MAG: prephenate dehydrogenase/arogenate dehydrogenase family protein [Pirellulales bacterium]|nr:prephenate dehydrogenase/arogenate dehydrogenase family protein [Pirellulales bacterium]